MNQAPKAAGGGGRAFQGRDGGLFKSFCVTCVRALLFAYSLGVGQKAGSLTTPLGPLEGYCCLLWRVPALPPLEGGTTLPSPAASTSWFPSTHALPPFP